MLESTSHLGATSVVELLQVLEGSGLRLVSRPESGNIRLSVANPTLFDPWTPPIGPRSGILLGIGVHPGADESHDIVREAARSGFGAIAVKSLASSSDAVRTLSAVADASCIALIVVDDAYEWRQLDALLTSAFTTVSEASLSLASTFAVGDLFALANAIAAMVGGATAIEDMHQRVLAYSTIPGQVIDEDRREGILGRQVPHLDENDEQYASVFRTSGAMRLPAILPGVGRLAVAVRAGAQLLGSIWVIDRAGELADDAPAALERAADIAALHMLHSRSAPDLAKQQRAELMRRLLEGGEGGRLMVEKLGLEASGPFVIVAFQPSFEAAEDELRMSRLVDLVAMTCDAYQSGTECVLIGTTMYALFTRILGHEVVAVNGLATRLVARAATTLRVSVTASIGTVVPTIDQIPRSRQEADLVLLLLSSSAAGTVGSAHDMRSRLALLELAQIVRDTPSLMTQGARRVIEADAKHGTEYAKTLRIYLDCLRDIGSAAVALSLHPNSLRYRLRRAGELFDLDLNDPDDSLMLWLGLRVTELA